MIYKWNNINTIASKSYVCGYCGNDVASEKGWTAYNPNIGASRLIGHVHICHQCKKPTFFDADGKQTPGMCFGNDVENIDDELVKNLYKELRDCMSMSAYTPVILSARKLLMHIAVAKGADENKKFIEYVEFLSDKNFIPPDAKDWVDHIREKGNEANHEIVEMSKEDAEDLITFLEMLLKLIYEFPARMKVKNDNKNNQG